MRPPLRSANDLSGLLPRPRTLRLIQALLGISSFFADLAGKLQDNYTRT